MAVMKCAECGIECVRARDWYSKSLAERDQLRAQGLHVYLAKGLCGKCYSARLRREAGAPVRKAPDACRECGTRLVSHRAWWKKTAEERARLRKEGFSAHQGKGLCAPCFRARYPDNEPPKCPDCDRKMKPRTVWDGLNPYQRDVLRSQGWVRAESRGRCNACAQRHRNTGKPYVKKVRPADVQNLEVLPDDRVHPEHLRFRQMQRFFRAKRRRVSL